MGRLPTIADIQAGYPVQVSQQNNKCLFIKKHVIINKNKCLLTNKNNFLAQKTSAYQQINTFISIFVFYM